MASCACPQFDAMFCFNNLRGQMFKRTKPSPQRLHQPHEEPSYIARNTEFDGNLVTDGEIHIDGLVTGTVQARTCLVDSEGEVMGGILAEVVFIRGRVIGPVSASQVNISAGAHVVGNVSHESISIENGAYVLGNISHRDQPVTVTHDPLAKPNGLTTGQPVVNIWDKLQQPGDDKK